MGDEININDPAKKAGGWGALRATTDWVLKANHLVATTQTLLKVDQQSGFDCPGCAAGYFPEMNQLVASKQWAEKSQTPLSKLIPVTVQAMP